MVRGMTAPPDLTRLCEKVAHELATRGVAQPVAAAVAIACRGRSGLEPAAFAASIGVDVAVVDACEAGRVAFGDLPAALVADHTGLDLFALADLEATMRGRAGGTVPAGGPESR
jgi:hypothetical protein